MKKSKFISAVFVLLSFFSFSQEDTIHSFKIAKSKEQLFQGDSDEIVSWYFFVSEDDFCYLANLELPEEEIYAWFVKRKNSENIFKSKYYSDNPAMIYLSKSNEPDVVLPFRLSQEGERLELASELDQKVYIFRKINIQE